MKIRILFISLLLFSLFPTIANAVCPEGDGASTDYIRRDDNRCEGILPPLAANSNSLPNLISISTSNLTQYPNILKIKVPAYSRYLKPIIRIQSRKKRYLLDELDTEYNEYYFDSQDDFDNQDDLSKQYGFAFFDLDTTKVLQKEGVLFNRLRYLAYIRQDSEVVHFPVILGESSGKYEFVIFNEQRTALPVLEIRYQGKKVFKDPRLNPVKGPVDITWDYRSPKAPAGIYELYLENSEGRSRTFLFEHDPNWFNN